MSTGTFDCPICGFDKPHTHGPIEVAKRGTFNDLQREAMRDEARHQYRMATLRAEFDKSPRAYVNRYGTINSAESVHIVNWLLERIDRTEAPGVDIVAALAAARLRVEALEKILAVAVSSVGPTPSIYHLANCPGWRCSAIRLLYGETATHPAFGPMGSEGQPLAALADAPATTGRRDCTGTGRAPGAEPGEGKP